MDDPKPPEQPSNVIDFDVAKQTISELSRLDPIRYGQSRKASAKKLGISVTVLDKEVTKRRRLPAVVGTGPDFVLAENGAIQPVFANVAAVLRHHEKMWPLRFDEFSQRQYLGERPLQDADLQQIAEWVQRQGVLAGRKIIDDAAIYVANSNKFHEVKDWLEALKWDGIARTDMMLIDHGGAEDTPLHRAFTAKWMIQAVARIYEPGCQADATLQLEGDQGMGKSTMLRALFGDRWFTDHLPSLDSKDAMIQLLGVWCIEIAELATLGRAENAKAKQFLTSRDDRFRLPWDRLAKEHPRQSVFATTVNPGAAGTLKDETGGRRFWPVYLKHVDCGQILDRREQFWAESVARYKTGETWHIPNGDLSEAAETAQSDRYINDPWQEAIDGFIAQKTWVTHAEIFTDCLNITAKADWGQPDQNRITRCLTHAGWERKQRRVDKKPKWGYAPKEKGVVTPDAEPRFDLEEP